jgi:hypothetical protein
VSAREHSKAGLFYSAIVVRREIEQPMKRFLDGEFRVREDGTPSFQSSQPAKEHALFDMCLAYLQV